MDSSSASAHAALPAEKGEFRDFLQLEPSRIAKEAILRDLFHHAWSSGQSQLSACVALMTMQLEPAAKPAKLGMGDALLLNAIATAVDSDVDSLKDEYKRVGDLGTLVASRLDALDAVAVAEIPEPLSVTELLGSIVELRDLTGKGKGSHSTKVEIVASLLRRCSPAEAQLLTRSIRGKSRAGVGQSVLLASLAQAALLREPDGGGGAGGDAKVEAKRRRDASEIVSNVFKTRPCYYQLVEELHLNGLGGLVVRPRAGVALQAMSAAPAKSVDEVFERFAPPVDADADGVPGEEAAHFIAECKYDGERCQLHLLESGEVRLFARSLDDVTNRFPDLCAELPMAIGTVREAIFDAELCAYDAQTDQPLPFQTLANRPRLAPSAEQIEAVPVRVYLFDLISCGGESLCALPLASRRARLREVLRPSPLVRLADAVEVRHRSNLEEALERVAHSRAEGLMCKRLRGPGSYYEPGKRSLHWLKLKLDYLDGLGDTVDLVPIGAYAGEGKRHGGFGAYLLAARSPTSGRWQPVCKLGSGFTDADLERLNALFGTGERSSGPAPLAPEWVELAGAQALPPATTPDVWLEPRVVWEVKASELSLSPTFSAGSGIIEGEPGRGVALRFPRFVRERDDKSVDDATSGAQLAAMYESQLRAQLGDNGE